MSGSKSLDSSTTETLSTADIDFCSNRFPGGGGDVWTPEMDTQGFSPVSELSPAWAASRLGNYDNCF